MTNALSAPPLVPQVYRGYAAAYGCAFITFIAKRSSIARSKTEIDPAGIINRAYFLKQDLALCIT